MSQMVPAKKTNIRDPLIILVVVVVGFWWLINVFNTGNPLFFLPFQPTYVPSRIVVRDYGTAVTLRPGDDGFDTLTAALDETLSSFTNTALVDIGLSEETMRRYAEEELVLELYYGENLEFNTSVRMTNVNQLLIPIDATHADNNYVFIGANGAWRVGAMEVADMTSLKAAMRTLGYLAEGE